SFQNDEGDAVLFNDLLQTLVCRGYCGEQYDKTMMFYFFVTLCICISVDTFVISEKGEIRRVKLA
ncbi:hypothetical protein, partial [Shewanella sp.]|uniref:hypothetical protein n=1 Tax=Shewanella sp. TaxID=50422 RepID=UPI003D14D2F1